MKTVNNVDVYRKTTESDYFKSRGRFKYFVDKFVDQ